MRTPASAKAPSKQFLEIGGEAILIHTLRKFAQHPAVKGIVLALRANELTSFGPEIAAAVQGAPISLVEGGASRQQSVANGLASLNVSDEDIVLVHDAVRPFVSNDVINGVVAGVEKYGAAIVGVPAIDTIKRVERTAEGALIRATIPREQIVQAQTPQGSRVGLLKRAFAEAEAEGFNGTDEASLIEHLGEPVHVVMGSARNIKITTPADLELAELYAAQDKRESK